MRNKYIKVWGAFTCANVWFAAGNTWLGWAFIALAATTLFLVKEDSRHD